MKVTSFTVSKKLAEIGFKADHSLNYIDTRKSWKSYNCRDRENFIPFDNIEEGDPELELRIKEDNHSSGYNDAVPLPAYDLETILLEALPTNIKVDGFEYNHMLYIGKSSLGYELYDPCCGNADDITRPDKELRISREDQENLAELAGKLLILLHEKGIIKFN